MSGSGQKSEAPADGGESRLPQTFLQFTRRFPKLAAAHQQIGDAADAAGPLDSKTCALIKIGIALGAGLESALRSHVRRAMQAGATPEEIEQAIVQGMNTVGFPRTVAAWSWAQIQFQRELKGKSTGLDGHGRDV